MSLQLMTVSQLNYKCNTQSIHQDLKYSLHLQFVGGKELIKTKLKTELIIYNYFFKNAVKVEYAIFIHVLSIIGVM